MWLSAQIQIVTALAIDPLDLKDLKLEVSENPRYHLQEVLEQHKAGKLFPAQSHTAVTAKIFSHSGPGLVASELPLCLSNVGIWQKAPNELMDLKIALCSQHLQYREQ